VLWGSTSLTDFIDLLSNQGLAVAIAIYLTYWITTKLGAKLDSIEYKLEQILIELRKLNNRGGE
jgi:hypothetical protein